MNREWHLAHVLGSKASLDRRVEWHLEHARLCGCGPVPPSVAAEMRARSIDVPERRSGSE